MKTIEELAKEFSNTKGSQSCKLMREVEYDTGRFVGFKAGVEFAQRWISVEEELPEYHGIDFYVLMKNERLDSDDINLGLIEGIDDVENVYQYATHWRPIELK